MVTRSRELALLFVALSVGVISCGGPTPPAPAPTEILAPTGISEVGPTDAVNSPGPELVATLPTATRIPVEPASEGTPLPAVSEVIAPANAANLVEIARWGKGPGNSVRFSPDGQLLAVASPIGVFFYDPNTLQEIRHIDTQATAGDVAFSPDGQDLAVVVNGHMVKLYDVVSGQELRTFSGHGVGVNSVAFSPDGKTLAYGLSDATAVLAEVASGNELRTLKGHANSVTRVVFLPDGKTLATGSKDLSVRLWDVATGSFIRTLGVEAAAVGPGGPGKYAKLAASPSARTSATAADRTSNILWEGSRGNRIRTLGGVREMERGGAFDGTDVAVSPDGKTLASTYGWDAVTLWDTDTGRVLHTIAIPNVNPVTVAFSPDGQTLAVGTDAFSTYLFDVESGNPVRELTGYQGFVHALAFSPNGQILAVGSQEDTVVLFGVHSGKILRASKEHFAALTQLALSQDGNTIIAAYFRFALKIFDVPSGESRVVQVVDQRCWDGVISLSPDGKTLAMGCGSNIARLDVPSGRTLGYMTRQPYAESPYLSALAFSPDGGTLAIGMMLDEMGPEIRQLNVASGDIRESPAAFTSSVATVAYSPDGRLLAAGPNMTTGPGGVVSEEKIRLWDAASMDELVGLPGYFKAAWSLAFSPDSRLLASGSEDQRIKIWDVANGQAVHEFAAVGLGIRLAFSPDGGLLIAGTSDGRISVWDAATWEQLARLTGHTGAVTGIAFSADGNLIISGAEDGTIRWWAVRP